jgi:hypothetical protein
MVDSRQKGRTAELNARNVLKEHTGLEWERTPLSGALNAKHKLKGDLYIPESKNTFCVEVKHYKDDHLTSKWLTSKSPTLQSWWEQTVREAEEMNREPLLLFKYNRSKWFVAMEFQWHIEDISHIILYESKKNQYIYVHLLEEWLEYMSPKDFKIG